MHYGKLKDVNTTDIVDAIRLGCNTMQRLFNGDDNNMPFMVGRARPQPALYMSAGYDGHLPGRHLNALLNAESAVGVALDESAIEKHKRAVFFSYSGPLALPLGRRRVGEPLSCVAGHNLREGFHALYALAAFRDDEQACIMAERSIELILDLLIINDSWDVDRLESMGLVVEDRQENFTRTLPRAIGSLVKYYRVTGHGPALELAILFKEKLLSDHFFEDGLYSVERLGTHGHSIACDLSSLAQLADLTNDLFLLERVKIFYDNGMWDLRDQIGWVIEKTGESAIDRPDVGEGNSTGDLVETALILGRRGYPHYFEDAERMLRCHLLPSQLRDVDFIGDQQIAKRIRGGWGFPAPYGHEPLELDGFDAVRFHSDIVGGVVASLCEAYRGCTRFDDSGHHVDLLFDRETDAINVESNYTNKNFGVTLKQPGPLWIRIPSWADGDWTNITSCESRIVGEYLFISEPPVGLPIRIPYELPQRSFTLQHRNRNINVSLRGDSVDAMNNFGADLTFFDNI